ncbi:MAG: acetyl-coenzyme A synthetase [Verrucomicrobia bacterium]|nr:MAG: acetyl-coenzyme A synthetase [Verrucomicrobiota bacterium]
MKIDNNIESHLIEKRVFKPSKDFAKRAQIKSLDQYRRMYRESISRPDKFWGREAKELTWQKQWKKVVEWKVPFAKWFVGGKLNLSENCLDRHLASPRRNKAAILWEGEPGDRRTLTYQQLHHEVCRFANVLKRNKIDKGDRVIIYLPTIPEAAIAMLACARIGAVHSVVFGGFSADAIRDRIADSGAIAVITADGSYRRGAIVPLKKNVDDGLHGKTSIKRVIVFRRAGNDIHMEEGRDVWWHRELEYVDANCPPAALDSEHPLYILYTSGSTGKPKGILHTTGGYLVGIYSTMKYVFDVRDEDIFWCTADVGWVTGHSYVVYGPLANGATTLMYEGAPNWPEPDRFWRIIEDYRVNILYTAPTAIRAFIRWGDEWVAKHDLSSLRLLGTVGEGAIPTKPGSATLPFFGVDAAIVDEKGSEVGANVGGKLIIRRPWPAMLRTIYGDKERYKKQYWSEFKGNYLTGDGARRDEDGYFWIVGRIDDVLNVAGHRLGTSEIESALVSHARVAEAAVVGRPDDLKGQSVVAFVTLKSGVEPSFTLKRELRDHVGAHIGAIAKPDEVRFAEVLPKTRSGKIMRRLLKEIASGARVTGDTTTLEDFSVLTKLRDSEE